MEGRTLGARILPSIRRMKVLRRKSFLFITALLMLMLCFSFNALADESPIQLKLESGETISCYVEPWEDDNSKFDLYLTLPEGHEGDELTTYVYYNGKAKAVIFQTGTFDETGDWSYTDTAVCQKNTPVTIDTTLLKETYSPGDSRQMINTAGSGIFYLHLAPPAPEVKTFKTGGIANYAGNAMDCPLAATFENTADDTPVKLYITAQENGTSAQAVEGTLQELTASQVGSEIATPETFISLDDLEAGNYWVVVEVGESRAYRPVTVYATAREYAEAARERFVNWYQTKGFYSGENYLGLSAQTGNGTGIDWEAYIFGAMGYEADSELLASSDGKTYLDMKEEHFSSMAEEDLVKNEGSAPAAKILGRQILGIAGLGGDPRNIGGKNLVEAMISLAYKDHDIEGGELNLDADGGLHIRVAENDTICECYFLLALEVCNATEEEGYTEEVRAAGLKAIRNYWGSVDFSEYTALGDFYSMSLFAHSFLNDVEGMEGEAQKMLDQFRENYKTVIKNGSTMNVFSIAVAHTTLAASGLSFEEYTTDPAWTDANGQSELSKLLEDQNEGGGIGQYDTRMAIYEVLQGLTDMLNGKTCFEIAHETYMEAYPQYSDGYAEAQSVKAQIEALPATITLEQKSAVEAARTAYDALSDAAKALVDEATLAKLTAAEASIAQLTADADKARVVEIQINALPASLTLADKDEVKAARAAYGALSEGEKARVSADVLKKLTDAEDILKELGVSVMTDVAKNQWFYNDVAFCIYEDLFKGMTETTFGPDLNMTRGQFVTVLGRYAGIEENDDSASAVKKFSDVEADDYFAAYVAWAVEKGITDGVSATSFAPEEPMSREQMATFMTRFAKAMNISLAEADHVKFADDEKIGDWAKDAVYRMKAAGLLEGRDGNAFDPQGKTLRSEVAAVLHRFLIME